MAGTMTGLRSGAVIVRNWVQALAPSTSAAS